MYKVFIISIFSFFLIISCSKKNNELVIEKEPTELEVLREIYSEALEALKKGDAYYAGKKFKEVEGLMPKSKWSKKSLEKED